MSASALLSSGALAGCVFLLAAPGRASVKPPRRSSSSSAGAAAAAFFVGAEVECAARGCEDASSDMPSRSSCTAAEAGAFAVALGAGVSSEAAAEDSSAAPPKPRKSTSGCCARSALAATGCGASSAVSNDARAPRISALTGHFCVAHVVAGAARRTPLRRAALLLPPLQVPAAAGARGLPRGRPGPLRTLLRALLGPGCTGLVRSGHCLRLHR